MTATLLAMAALAGCGLGVPGPPVPSSTSSPAASDAGASPSPVPGSSANVSCAGGVSGPWPGYCTIFGPLPSGSLATQLASMDQQYQLAWNQAVYTKGASTEWENYVTSEMQTLLQGDLPSDMARAATYYRNVSVQISDIAVSPMADFPGSEMVDFCVHWNGSLYYEEQDALSQVNGSWKIGSIDTFTSTEGHTLPGEPTRCYSTATQGT
jgi:hypothetical protein